eukprot:1156393-Pelagomonas_calceolata.AAC.13
MEATRRPRDKSSSQVKVYDAAHLLPYPTRTWAAEAYNQAKVKVTRINSPFGICNLSEGSLLRF